MALVFKEEEDHIMTEFAKRYLEEYKVGPLLKEQRRIRNNSKRLYQSLKLLISITRKQIYLMWII